MDTVNPQITLALPCYNERDNISVVVNESIDALERLGLTWELLVIDNHSNDGTPDEVQKIVDCERRVRLIVHESNRFYSGSCRTALNEARGQLIAIMDSDGQFTAKDLPRFVKAIEGGANLVFGWRKIRYDPRSRKVMSWVFNRMARKHLGCHLHDLNVGIRMFDRKFARAAEIRHALNLANPELFTRAKQAGLIIDEVEATHFAREKGKSCHNVFKLYSIYRQVRRYFRALRTDLIATQAAMIKPAPTRMAA